MITHFGYTDGSGKYYVSIDDEKCDGCKSCVEKCPQKILTIDTVMVDLDDKDVAAVLESQRKKIKYTCASCHQGKELPCVLACTKGAIGATWETK
jgi:NAD-dependent dihydropyrimidine dehydrogenase PreA subunit